MRLVRFDLHLMWRTYKFICGWVAGSKILAVSGSSEVSMTQVAMASPAFTILKDQVSNFAENTKILVSVLDDLGKMHPFIQGPSIAFQ